jgi:hypothetical protein
MPLATFLLHQELRCNLLLGHVQVKRNTAYIRDFQKGADDLTTIGALPAVDLRGHRFVVLMNDRIDLSAGKSRTFQKAAEGPIGIRPLARQPLDSPGIYLKSHLRI